MMDSVIQSNTRPFFKFYFIVLSLFTATWLTSDIAAVKLVSIFGITLTGGFIVFPFTTILSSIIVEVYGYKSARQAIWAGLTLNLVFILFINIVYLVPASPHWALNDQFKNILLPETRIVIASLLSYFIADFINNYLMAKMKIKCQGRSLTKRIMLSCSFSFFIDLLCFLTLAFYGTMSNKLLTQLIIYAYIKKLLFQVALLPLTYYLINMLKKAEDFDIYDYDTSFNPFSLDNIYYLHTSSPQKITDIAYNNA